MMSRPFRALLIATLAAVWTAAPTHPARSAEWAARLAASSSVPLVLPHDLTLTPDGAYLVVADMGQNRIVLLDPDTLAFVAHFGEAEGLSFPHDVAFDDQGRLMVADSGNDRIVFYHLNRTTATLADTWDGLDGVEGVVQAPNGDVYAALVVSHRVVRLDGRGRVVAEADEALGMALNRPHDVDVSRGQGVFGIIATDPGNHRLIAFDADLNPLYEISTWDPPFSEPKYISITPSGDIFVADQYNNRVRVLSSTSRELGELAANEAHLPEGVYVRGTRAWVSDTERGRVVLYHLDETR